MPRAGDNSFCPRRATRASAFQDTHTHTHTSCPDKHASQWHDGDGQRRLLRRRLRRGSDRAADARTRLVEGGLATRLQRQVELVERDDVSATTCGRARYSGLYRYSSRRSASYCSTALGSRAPSSSSSAPSALRARDQTLCGPPSLRNMSAPPVSPAAKCARGVRSPTRSGWAGLLCAPIPVAAPPWAATRAGEVPA